MPKRLTKKQKGVIDLIIKGVEPLDAVQSSYDCAGKDPRASARVILHKLFQNDLFNKELTKAKHSLREKMINKQARFIDILKEYAPPVEVAKRLAELIFEGDKRTSDSAIDKYLKLSAEYPERELGITMKLEKQREKVLTSADIEKQIEERVKQRLAERERKRLLKEGKVEEAEIIEDSGALKKEKELLRDKEN